MTLIRHATLLIIATYTALAYSSYDPTEDDATFLLRARSTWAWRSDGGVGVLIFRKYETEDRFTVQFAKSGVYARDYPIAVSAGVYYLEAVRTQDSTITLPTQENDVGMIVVEAGKVTYAGDWILIREAKHDAWMYRKEITYDAGSINKFRKKHPKLATYPLNVATELGGVFRGDWGTINYSSQSSNPEQQPET
jgi:hypothetical protein